ncbi:hypothetical protein [Kribbella amoyensis]|uniref:hypothetical protein n=1 Tax=Kribbella amoyensis TaxID=996641 RepID=UPI0011A00DBC|nr:hypothetical protein [Kribbella amoyensis]
MTTALLALSLTSCSGDRPICYAVDTLKSSVQAIQQIDFGSPSARTELKDGLNAVEDDLAQVKTDAEAEYPFQIEAVERTYGTLQTALSTAIAGPTAATLAAVVAGYRDFIAAVDTMLTTVKADC